MLKMGGGVVNFWLTNSNNWLETAKLVHSIATQIIDFFSHIEEFQKRLWLKKEIRPLHRLLPHTRPRSRRILS